jgi:hypothetical protein
MQTMQEFMAQGAANQKPEILSAIPAEAFQKGIEIEKEHSDDPTVQAKISADHLAELGVLYYDALELMEDFLERVNALPELERMLWMKRLEVLVKTVPELPEEEEAEETE